MLDVRLDEPPLFLGGGIHGRVARVRGDGVVVVVRPLGEVVRELETAEVGARVLEVDDDQLLVLVGWLEERRLLVVGAEAEDVAVLGLYAGS